MKTVNEPGLEKTLGFMQERGLDALIVSQPENRRYLSGYTAPDSGIQESSGFLLIIANETPYLLTDSRFTLQAEKEAPGFHVYQYGGGGLLAALSTLLAEKKIHRLGFEAEYFLYSTWLKLQELGKKLHLVLLATEHLVESVRQIKTPAELALIRRASHLNERVFQQVYARVKVGMSEKALCRLIENTMLDLGAEGPSFPTIVAFGANAAKPHAMPSERTLKQGEPVLIDMGLVLDGYCSDMTRTFVVGEADTLFVERSRLVRRAQKAAVAVIRPGVTGAEVDRAAREIFRAAGCAEAFGHSLGHGVGLAVHENPRLSPAGTEQLTAGMVVTVEPGLYFAGWGGIRLENMAIVTEDGCEIINEDTTFLDL